jgi:plasmid stabilization system protein ParE
MATIRLLGDARQSILAALKYSLQEHGEDATVRYAALINQAITDFTGNPDARTVRRMEHPGKKKILLRYDLPLSQNNIPSGIGRVARPRHFLVGHLEGDVLRILFLAHDRMKSENILRRSRRSDMKDD